VVRRLAPQGGAGWGSWTGLGAPEPSEKPEAARGKKGGKGKAAVGANAKVAVTTKAKEEEDTGVASVRKDDRLKTVMISERRIKAACK
jgi:hypothetical protein